MKKFLKVFKKLFVFMLIIPMMFVFASCGKDKDKGSDKPDTGIEQPGGDDSQGGGSDDGSGDNDPETPGGSGGEAPEGPGTPDEPEVVVENFSVELNYDLPAYISDLLADETKTAVVADGYTLPTFVGTEYESYFDGWYASESLNADDKIESAKISGTKDQTVSVYAKWKESDMLNYFHSAGIEFRFDKQNKQAFVKSYDGSSKVVVLPWAVNDSGTPYFVEGIDANAFKDKDIEELRTSTLLTEFSVGENAFENSNLKKFEFLKLKSASVYSFKNTKITSATIGARTKSVATSMFEGCTELVSVDFTNAIGDEYLEIPTRMFYGCSKLSNVYLSLVTTTVGISSFEGCSSLTNLNFLNDSSVTNLRNRAFANCANLDKIMLPSKIVSYGTQIFVGSKVGELTLSTLPAGGFTNTFGDLSTTLKKITLTGSSITTIPNSYLTGYQNLTDFVMCDSIVSIGEDAFANCGKLENITFSSALVGDSLNIAAFANSAWYKNLINMQDDDLVINNTLVYVKKEVTGTYAVPDGVVYIGKNVFRKRTGISTISIPASVEYINATAFNDAAFTSILVDVNNENYATESGTHQINNVGSVQYSVLYRLQGSQKVELLAYASTGDGGMLVVPESVNIVNDTAFDLKYAPEYVFVDKILTINFKSNNNSNVSYIIAKDGLDLDYNSSYVIVYEYLLEGEAPNKNYSIDDKMTFVEGVADYASFGFKAGLNGLNVVVIEVEDEFSSEIYKYYYLIDHANQIVTLINTVD